MSTAGSRAPRRRGPASGRHTARGVALEALVAIEGGARANLVVPDLLGASDLDGRDRGLVTELVYGTTRMRRALDWLAARYLRTATDATVQAALRMGAYQLTFLRVPPHAAVSATVAEVGGPGRTVVNAVLRRLSEEVERGPVRWPDPATELSYPDWIVGRLAHDLGTGPARDAMSTMNQAAQVTTRADGYVQDRASQWVAAIVAGEGGDRLLDLCAAPGGKATALAYGPPSPGHGADSGPLPPASGTSAPAEGASASARPAIVVAGDLAMARTRVIAGNADDLGLANVVAVVADGLRPPWRPDSFDQVLVDAPCSGLGVLRRRPDARWRVQPGDVERLTRLQANLVSAALRLVGPGGIVTYSVCTLTRAETAGVDHWLAQAYPECVPLAPPAAPWQPLGRGALLLPQAADTDGMYLLRVRRPV